jgi:UDP-N-acetylmuramoylalanine-D-glutamate ligase
VGDGRDGGVTAATNAQATNLESTAVGVEGIPNRAVVLLGGQAKRDPLGNGLGFGQLAPSLARHRAVLTVRLPERGLRR